MLLPKIFFERFCEVRAKTQEVFARYHCPLVFGVGRFKRRRKLRLRVFACPHGKSPALDCVSLVPKCSVFYVPTALMDNAAFALHKAEAELGVMKLEGLSLSLSLESLMI